MARRRRSHRRRRNPVRLAGQIKKFLPLPPMAQIASLAAGSWAGGFLTPRLITMIPFFKANAFGRILGRLVAFGGLSMAGNMVFKGKSAMAEMFSLGVLANQIPHLTNEVLSFANMKINFGQSDDEQNELEYFYGEEPLMLSEDSPEMGQGEDTTAEMGYYFGPSSVPMVG